MFVRRHAARLKIKGWVRNLSDGRVEAWGHGPKEALAEFESLLREGPPNAMVETLMVGRAHGTAPLGDFAVKGDGEKPWPDES
jgi:acylphosphatase